VTAETDEQRRMRERQRGLFDGVAELYDATRLQVQREERGDLVITDKVQGPGRRPGPRIGSTSARSAIRGPVRVAIIASSKCSPTVGESLHALSLLRTSTLTPSVWRWEWPY